MHTQADSHDVIPLPAQPRLAVRGGGCFPVNPDVNEQPATARPPPDIPFKPELQEDNGSVRPQERE